MTISKEQFLAYVKVQMSGLTNMFELDVVSMLSGLKKAQILEIMEQYGALEQKYPNVKK